jgi:hypothetical protein
MESKLIALYGTLHPKGYNLMNGGEGSGSMTAPGVKRKSESLKAAFASPEAKQRISELQKRLWADPAEKAKRAAAISQAFADPETKAKLVAAQKRGNADPAAKARKSEIMKQRMADPEYRRKTVERMLKARGLEFNNASPGTIHTLA